MSMEDTPLSAERVFRSEYLDMHWTARRGFRFPLAPRSAAIDGGMADVLALDEVDDVFGDVGGVVADALEIVVDARDRQDEAEIDGHELVKREKLNDAVVDFHLELVDGVFFLEDAVGELFVGFQNGVNGLVDGAFREAAHPKQALFHL